MRTVMPRENDPRKGRFEQRPRNPLAELATSAYEAIVLERLAKHACRITGVDRTAVFVRDRRDPRVVIAAAGHGVSWDFLGSRLAADEGFVGEVLAQGEAIATTDPEEIAPTLGCEGDFCAGAAAPIRSGAIVIGAIAAVTDEVGRVFDGGALERLEVLGHVAAAASEREERRGHCDRGVRAHVESLAA